MIFIYFLSILIGLVLLATLFINNDYSVERIIIIDQPVGRVFDYLRYLQHQNNYNKWWMADPNTIKSFQGKDGSVGCIISWDSKNKQLGKGEQEIISIDVNQRIDFEIRFIKPFENVAHVYMVTESITDDITRFKWVFSGTNKFPLMLMNPFINKILGKDLEASAIKLKEILEKEISSD
jgi:hypothetical protein